MCFHPSVLLNNEGPENIDLSELSENLPENIDLSKLSENYLLVQKI